MRLCRDNVMSNATHTLARLHTTPARKRELVNELTDLICSAISLKILDAMTFENTLQLEGGKGSIQSLALLRKQRTKKAGNWADQKLKAGKTPTQVKDILKAKLKAKLKDPEAIRGIKHITMQGIFAIGLQDREIVDFLKVKEEDWNKGKIPVELHHVIEALQAKIKKWEQAAPETRFKATPAILALAMLEAFREMYGEDFLVLNMRKQIELKTGEVAMASRSHVAAVIYFDGLQNEYHSCLNRIADILALLPPLSPLT